LWAFAFLAAVVVRTGILPGSGGQRVPVGTQMAEARPAVQGSTSRGTSVRGASKRSLAAVATFGVATKRSVQQGVGVWVAARWGPGALGALRHTTEAAPSVIPPSWLVLHRPVAVSVEVQGKDLDELTNAATVGQLLSAMGIEPDGDDRVAPPSQTPLHPLDVVRFDRVDVRAVRVTSKVDYAVHTTTSTSLAPGQLHLVTPGVEGSVARTYRIRSVNGSEVSRVLVSQEVVRAAVDEVREIGAAASQSPVPTPTPTTPAPKGSTHTETGQATWYDTGHSGLTAAHPWLPFGTHVNVTDLANGKTVTVVINDRGPFGGRIIDLSSEAFALLAPLPQGVCEVRLTW
jgi:hypothetical protein